MIPTYTTTYSGSFPHQVNVAENLYGTSRAGHFILKHWELFFAAHAFLELGFDIDYREEMPAPRLETIGQKCRFFEIELLQSFIRHIQALVLDSQDTKEDLNSLIFKRPNSLAH